MGARCRTVERYGESVWVDDQVTGYPFGLPAKLFEYLGARRPILVLSDHAGDIGWVLREAGVPHRVAPLADSDSAPHQLALDERARGRREAEQAADRAARRFGSGAVRPGSLLRDPGGN